MDYSILFRVNQGDLNLKVDQGDLDLKVDQGDLELKVDQGDLDHLIYLGSGFYINGCYATLHIPCS